MTFRPLRDVPHGRRRPDPWRPVRRLALLAVVAMTLTGCWLQPGWGPHRTGHNPDETALTLANVADLTQAWSVDLGADPLRDPAVTSKGVHAVSGRTVSTLGLDDGDLRWSADVFPRPDYPDGVFSIGSPSVRAGHVLAPAYVDARSGLGGTGTYAFDAATGEGGDRLGYAGSPDSVTVDGDTLATTHGEIWASDSQFIFSFVSVDDLSDPSQSWTTMVGNDEFVRSPAVAGDRVIFTEGGSTYAFTRSRPTECGGDPVVCQPIWVQGFGGHGSPVISDDGQTVYVASSQGQVRAFDTEDGSVLWTTDVGAPLFASVTVGDGWLYVASTDGRVYAIELGTCGTGTCTVAWAGATGSRVVKQAALAGGVLYVAAQDGTIHAFAATGCGSILCLPVWETATGSAITGGPTVALGRLLVGTEDGRLIAYRPS
jgi:outer membrane protein assembly factor BamB